MGQIFNRIFDIAKANRSSRRTANFFSERDDDELKRIIDELNSSNEGKNQETGSQKSEEKRVKEEKDNKNITMTVIRAFQVLKIDKNVSSEDVKKAYIERIKEYHPDRLENFGDELKDLAKKKTQEINEAYSLIMNSKDSKK